MITVRRFRRTERFEREIKRAPREIRVAARGALEALQATPIPASLRLHRLKGLPKPTLWKIDVTSNHAWQITFEMDGNVAILRRLARHKSIDRSPR